MPSEFDDDPAVALALEPGHVPLSHVERGLVGIGHDGVREVGGEAVTRRAKSGALLSLGPRGAEIILRKTQPITTRREPKSRPRWAFA